MNMENEKMKVPSLPKVYNVELTHVDGKPAWIVRNGFQPADMLVTTDFEKVTQILSVS